MTLRVDHQLHGEVLAQHLSSQHSLAVKGEREREGGREREDGACACAEHVMYMSHDEASNRCDCDVKLLGDWRLIAKH